MLKSNLFTNSYKVLNLRTVSLSCLWCCMLLLVCQLPFCNLMIFPAFFSKKTVKRVQKQEKCPFFFEFLWQQASLRAISSPPPTTLSCFSARARAETWVVCPSKSTHSPHLSACHRQFRQNATRIAFYWSKTSIMGRRTKSKLDAHSCANLRGGQKQDKSKEQ